MHGLVAVAIAIVRLLHADISRPVRKTLEHPARQNEYGLHLTEVKFMAAAYVTILLTFTPPILDQIILSHFPKQPPIRHDEV